GAPADEAEAANLKEKALQYFSIASALPGSRLDPNFITELYLKKNETRLALFHAYEKYYEANDYEKEQLLKRIEEIEKGAAGELKNEEERWKSNYPYMPVHLFVFVGDKRDIYNTVYRDELEEIFIEEMHD
ncbi:MAG: hypothetical protein FJ088_07535, partial [Deltaproteobacteria bacterium]|nr:hypothetical protein [Deltaproteobacteria bacterium]